MRRHSLLAVAVVLLSGGHAFAQTQVMPPLADVARKAEAAKATAKKAKKSYTNSDLSADPRGERAPAPAPAAAPTAAPEAGFVSKTTGKPVPAEEMVAASAAKAEEGEVAKESEATWRHRASAVRQQVDKMRERLAELSTPNQLTDENPRLKAENERDIANARTALDGLRKQWGRLETSAREKKIPLAWIEPAPSFQQ